MGAGTLIIPLPFFFVFFFSHRSLLQDPLGSSHSDDLYPRIPVCRSLSSLLFSSFFVASFLPLCLTVLFLLPAISDNHRSLVSWRRDIEEERSLLFSFTPFLVAHLNASSKLMKVQRCKTHCYTHFLLLASKSSRDKEKLRYILKVFFILVNCLIA